MSEKGMEGSLPKVNAEIFDEDRFILRCMVFRLIWSPGFPSTYGRRAKGRWIYLDRFNDRKMNADSNFDEQIGAILNSKRRMYGKKYPK